MVAVSVGIAGLLLGFVAGLWTFKVKSRWCPTCGGWTLAEPHIGHHERVPAVDVPRTSKAELRSLADES